MKKVFIGCAAVLLSLGLLAGCDNEEGDKAVSIKVDNAATVVVGDILELPYTVEPEKAKIEVLNDYEAYVTAEAEDGVLSLEGLAAGNATITLVGTYKKYTEANVNISVSVVTEKDADTEPEPVPTPETPTVSFSLSQTSCDLIVGETAEIEYTLDPSDATVTATSGNDDYVTAEVGTDVISLTGIGEGTTTVTVTASYEGYISAIETISVSVAQGTVAVTGVSIDQGSELTLAANATTTLTATVTPANATNQAVTWAVTGTEGVITLNTATGEVTAGSESGSTTVTVTTVDGGFTDSIAITVEEDVIPEVISIAFDSSKTYSVEVGETLDVGNDVIATWKDNVTGDTPEYVFTMTENSYASLSGSVITGVASTYGIDTSALPVVTASIKDNSNVASASQAITVTEAATLTGISFTSSLPTSVDAGDTINLSEYISITGTGDDWESLAANATVTYELGSTSVASISGSTVTTVSTITADASITVTAKLADYTDATSATATISVVAPLTIMSAAFKSASYELTVGTEKDFAGEIEVTYNKTDSGSITYNVELSADPSTNLTIDGTKVTATGNVESATLTATITWEGGSTTCTTSISAAAEPLTSRESYTVNFYFVDNDTPTQYYSIPSYSDAYVTGHLINEETWDNYVIDGFGALTEQTDNSIVCYTITFETILVGSRQYEIYLEFNNQAQNHSPADAATWEHQAFAGYFTVSDDEAVTSTDVYMVCNPSEHISDDASFVELTVAIKNTSSTGFGSGLYPQFKHWITDNEPASAYVNMTQGACGTYTAATDYYFTVKADGTTSDGGNHTYVIDRGAAFKFEIACSGGTDEWSECLMFANNPWTADFPISSYEGDITIDEGYLVYDSVLIVLELDFSAYQKIAWNANTSGLFNKIITGVAAYPNWEAQ